MTATVVGGSGIKVERRACMRAIRCASHHSDNKHDKGVRKVGNNDSTERWYGII